MRRILSSVVFGVALCAFSSGAESVFAQGTSAADAAALAATRASESRKKVSGAAKPEALAAIEAAEKAAKASKAAGEAATKAVTTAKNPAATLDQVKGDAAAAAKAALEAATAADGAASAAAAAAVTVTVEPARSIAGKAAATALVASKAALSASGAAEKANGSVAKATTVPEAQKAALTVAAETEKASYETSAASSETSTVATEAVTPSLPILGPRDENVLAALKARITGGAIFFNGAPTIVPNADRTAATIQSNQFSQAATYLAFEAQPRLWAAELGFCGKKEGCKPARERIVADRGYHRVYVDPFIAVRLTTIPVVSTTPQTGPIQAPTQAFLQSQKAAQLQLGAMAGVNFGKFAMKTTDFHWGVGPVFRFMFQSVTDSQRTLRLWDLDNDLFKLQSAGVRLTLYEKDQQLGETVREGWAPAAYVDVSHGTFENFETAVGNTPAAVECLRNPAACLVRPGGVPPSSEFDKTNHKRWYIEGRVFLQYLYLGFDLNTGGGPDDLRFIAGLTVKLDQFITRRD